MTWRRGHIMLDGAGCPWLLDRDCAGWYPEYFAYAAMHSFSSAGALESVGRG